MEPLKEQKNVMLELPFQELNVVPLSAPTLESELFAEKLHPNAQRDQNALKVNLLDN